jgi:nucleoside-diphosphate-sugar epimerase
MNARIIAVTGATGQQSGVVARKLLADGWKVRPLKRGTDKPAAFNFFNGKGYNADIPALRKLYPGLLTLEQWLRKNGWENAEPILMPEKNAWES